MRLSALPQKTRAPTPAPPQRGLLRRKCACGKHTAMGTTCASCAQKEAALRRIQSPAAAYARGRGAVAWPGGAAERTSPRGVAPAKAHGVLAEDTDRAKPSPAQGSATIQCDGSGGWEIVYGGWSGTTCRTKECVTAHESSHMADWKAKWPDGCKGQPKGYLPKGDPPDVPLMTVAEYGAFLKQSECRAHTVDLACAEALPRTKGCEATIDDYIKLTREQKAHWCPAMSRGAKVALGALGGALAGAGIGALEGGPLGALVGLGVGALVGGVAGALL